MIWFSTYSAPPESLFAASATSKACVDAQESLESRTMAAKDQFQTATCLHQPSSQVHEFLNHGLDPASLYGVAHRHLAFNKSDLPDEAQDIVSQTPESQDQGVGGEFARWEPFHVKIGLDLTMELFARSMVFVETDHLLHRQVQSGPPSFDLDLRNEQALPVAVYGALDCPHHPLELISFPFMDLADMDSEQSNSFPRSRCCNFSFVEYSPRPFELVFPSGIPFYDIADIPLSRQGNTGVQGIVSRIEAHEELSGSKAAGLLDDPLNKRNKSLLAMLTALPQLQLKTPSLPAQVSRHGGKTVPAIVDARNSFFFGLGIVHTKDIAVQRHVSGLKRGDGHSCLLEKLHRAGIGHSKQIRSKLVQPLAQSFGGWDSANAQSLSEILVFPAVCYGLEIALSHRQKSDIAAQDVVHADASATHGKGLPGFDRQRAQLIDTVSDENESGVGGIKFFVGLLDDKSFHVHPPSEFM